MKVYLLFFFVIFINLSCSTKSKEIEQNAPNILFLFADDQRYQTIAALGNDEIITPHLDELVKHGTTFSNAYIMGAMNGAVCAPSRAMLMTGRSIFNIHPAAADNLAMPDTLLPRALSANGYQTFHTGKWHNGRKAFQDAFDDGSKIFFGGMFDQYTPPTYEYQQDGSYPDSLKSTDKMHSSELYANAAIDYIQRQDKNDQPFMMYVAFQAPHDPRDVDQKYLDLYNSKNLSLPPNFLPEHPFDNGELNIRDEWLAGTPRTKDEVIANIGAYYAMITHLDEQIGRIIAALEEAQLRDNTIIIFSADNGLAVGQHGLMGKQNLYEHSIKIPLVFQGPGIPQNVQESVFIYLTDLYPTICDLTATKTPELVEGLSFAPLFKGVEKEHRTSMLFAYKNNQRAYREGDFKLIKYMVDGQRHHQLFNLAEDPWEKTNLYSSPEYKNMVNELEINMQKALLTSGDAVILNSDNWAVPEIPKWIDKVSQATIDWLRGLAERERELRGF